MYDIKENYRHKLRSNVDLKLSYILKYVPGRLTPNIFTVLNLTSMVFASFFILVNEIPLSFICYLLAISFDTLDGSLARFRQESTYFGHFFDGLVDRIGEIIFFISLFYSQLINHLIVVIFLSSTLLMSYIKVQLKRLFLDSESKFFSKIEQQYFMILFFILLLIGINKDFLEFVFGILTSLTIIASIELFFKGLKMDRMKKHGVSSDPTSNPFPSGT